MSAGACHWHRPLEGRAKLPERVTRRVLAFVRELDLPPPVFSTPNREE
jgi:hypothetical protein